MNRTDRVFFAIGWLLYALLAIVAILQKTDMFFLTEIPATCSFRYVTGLYCPGCGGTHAIVSLASGHLLESFLYHPFVPYTAACFSIFLLWNSACLLIENFHPLQILQKKAGRARFVHFHILYVYVGIGIIFLQWIIKNILLFIS